MTGRDSVTWNELYEIKSLVINILLIPAALLLLLSPVRVLGIQTETQIAALGANTCILSLNEIKCHGDWIWGVNANGITIDTTSPPSVAIDFGDDFTPNQISCGYIHCCTASTEKTSKCWGANYDGRLGIGDRAKRGGDMGDLGNNLPIIDWGTLFEIEMIAAGYDHTCALSTNHEIKCIGHLGSAGKLGDGGVYTNNIGDALNEMGDALISVNLGSNFDAVYIECGNAFSCALSSIGTVKCWGINDHGELGQDDTLDRGTQAEQLGDYLPEIELGTGIHAVTLRVGKYHVCVITNTQQLLCWGNNQYGQLGLGDSWNRGDGIGGLEMGDGLQAVDLGKNFVPIHVTLGTAHTCALSMNHTLKCFGYGYHGQMGYERGGVTEIIGRSSISEMGDNLPSVSLGTGFKPNGLSHGCWASHTCVVDDVLSDPFLLKCFGKNTDGQLGYGDVYSHGNGPNEMGDHLPFVDHGFTASSVAAAAGADSDSFDENVIGDDASHESKAPTHLKANVGLIVIGAVVGVFGTFAAMVGAVLFGWKQWRKRVEAELELMEQESMNEMDEAVQNVNVVQVDEETENMIMSGEKRKVTALMESELEGLVH